MAWPPAALAATLALLALLPGRVVGQECGGTNVRARGATGDGNNNDAWAFRNMEGDPGTGLIYMSDGTYRIAESLTLTKPVMGTAGAVFQVDWGVTLTLVNQPEHPLTTFFTGAGSVVFTDGTVRAYPEWWGARADGVSDDVGPLMNAFNAVAQTSNAMLYLTQTYGVGSELQFSNKATIFAQPTARFVSVNGNGRGVTFLSGGFSHKIVLPHLSGFGEWCLRLLGSDLSSLQLHTLAYCGEAIRLESVANTGDAASALDNTIWFDKIIDSVVGISIRANTGCSGAGCVFQGNQFVGNAIQGGPSTGLCSAFAYWTPESKQPAWDSNQFDIAIVTPPTNNPDYVVLRGYPQIDRAIVKIARLDPLAPGASIFNSNGQNMHQVTINLGQQLKENQVGLYGMLNLVTFTGATTPLPGEPPVRCVTQQGNKAGFNGGRSLVCNNCQLLVRADQDWQAGEVKSFYAYHQLATGFMFQLKCGAPAGPSGQPTIDCVQYTDNTNGAPGVPATLNELQLYVINLTGGTIRAGTDMRLTLSIGTLNNPSLATE